MAYVARNFEKQKRKPLSDLIQEREKLVVGLAVGGEFALLDFFAEAAKSL